MSMSQKPVGLGGTDPLPNGSGAAAILAAGIGCAMLGVLALAGDASPTMSKLLILYNPTGALSGVTTVSIIVWLVSWAVLGRQWGTRTVNLARVNVVAFVGLAIGLLLTFPPFMDMIQGK
jgi:hypothetical protein